MNNETEQIEEKINWDMLKEHALKMRRIVVNLINNIDSKNVKKVRRYQAMLEKEKDKLLSIVKIDDLNKELLKEHIIIEPQIYNKQCSIYIKSDSKVETADLVITDVSRIVTKESNGVEQYDEELHKQLILFLINIPSEELELKGDGVTRLLRDFNANILPYILALFMSKIIVIYTDNGKIEYKGLIGALDYITTALKTTSKTRRAMLKGALNPSNPKATVEYHKLVYQRIPENLARDLVQKATLEELINFYPSQIIKNSATKPLEKEGLRKQILEAINRANIYAKLITPYATINMFDEDIDAFINHLCDSSYAKKLKIANKCECGEILKKHWKMCPVCGNPINN